jgi:RNA polymerase sigma factor (sigma-70 family)
VAENDQPDALDSRKGFSPAYASAPGYPTHQSVDEDEQAFAAFYRHFIAKLVGFLICQGASAPLAADLAQDTMIKVWKKWSLISHPEAYARRIAGRSLIRHMVEENEVPLDQVATTTLARNQDAIADLEHRHVMFTSLRALPHRQRQVLTWTIIGYTPAEIAIELNLSKEAVRSSLMKARRRVIALLDEEERGDG